MNKQQITYLVTAAVSGAAFYWRWESSQKKWTVERAWVLSATIISVVWNLYMAIGG